MANGLPAGAFDKVMDAIKQLGVPIVISGILLWYMITKVDAVLSHVEDMMEASRSIQSEARQTQLEGRQTLMELRAAQVEWRDRLARWIEKGCTPTPPGGP